MRKPSWILACLVVLSAVGVHTRLESQETSQSPSDIGLSKVAIEEVAIPDAVVMNTSDPGDAPILVPVYDGSPPLIPHGIADFLTMTPDENSCIDCHQVEEKLSGEPTPIPTSHYVDLRNSPDTIQEEVAGARFHCTACHVPLTNASPLVENVFLEKE